MDSLIWNTVYFVLSDFVESDLVYIGIVLNDNSY